MRGRVKLSTYKWNTVGYISNKQEHVNIKIICLNNADKFHNLMAKKRLELRSMIHLKDAAGLKM